MIHDTEPLLTHTGSIQVHPITYQSAVSRALRLRCPRCGQGALFRKRLSMHNLCPHCGLQYERAPGYFLGSTYVNYGFISLSMTAMYTGLHFGAQISNERLTLPLLAYCVITPLVIFRHARAWWLAMDCYLDPISFDIENDERIPRSMPAQRTSENEETQSEAAGPSSRMS